MQFKAEQGRKIYFDFSKGNVNTEGQKVALNQKEKKGVNSFWGDQKAPNTILEDGHKIGVSI